MIGLTKMLQKLAVRVYFSTHLTKVIEANVISKLLSLEGNETVCDIACGSGYFSLKMAKAGCRVYGMDISQKTIRRASLVGEGHNCSFCLGNADMLPYKSSIFDKVVCICALEHFENDNLALQEAARVLKPGGVLALTVDSFTYRGIKNSFREFHRKAAHVVNYYSDSQLAQKLQRAGFQIEKSKYFISSPVPAFFFNTGKRLNWGVPYLALFPIMYPLSVASEHFFGRKSEGYLLAMKARKLESLCA